MEFTYEENKINIYENNILVGYSMFAVQSNNVFRILRLFVEEAYRGQGIAKLLMEKTIQLIIDSNGKALPICSYASAFFEHNKKYSYLLEK